MLIFSELRTVIDNDEPDRKRIALYIVIIFVYTADSGALKVAKGGRNKVRQLRDNKESVFIAYLKQLP